MTTLDRPVPYDLQAESAVLGALILDRDAVIKTATFLQPGDFYQSTHGAVYAAILALYRRREPPDFVTLCAELRRAGQLERVGGEAALVKWVNGVPTAVHVEYYARIVARTALLRRLIRIGGQIAGLGYEEAAEPDALVSQARALLAAISSQGDGGWTALPALWDRNLSVIEERERTGVVPGITTGFPTLDRHTGGWQPGDLVVPAALTSRGKSALTLNFMRAAAQTGKRVGMVSLETRNESASLRLLARESGIDLSTLRFAPALPRRDWDALGDMSADWAARCFFRDVPTVSVAAIAAALDQLRATEGCDLFIVDYLQLLAGPKASTRAEEVGGLARDLKLLAMQAELPVLCPSQLSRAAVGADVPGLHHLRESGGIEQNADIVLFLHRPDPTDKTRVDLILAKHREGVADEAVPLVWDGAHQAFTELVDATPEPRDWRAA